jgi:hypothetical protein
VKLNNLTNSIFAVLLLASPLVGAETDYPAADFQPKVLYKDSGYKAAEPKDSAVSSKSSSTSADDAQYPATNFQPKVLYKDSDYKPSASVPTARSTVSNKASASGDAEDTAPASTAAATNESGSSAVYPLILGVLGVVGFVFLKRRSQGSNSTSNASDSVRKSTGGLTGVAKYVNRVSGTGVARYLEKQVKVSPATGVAKYVAKQVVSAKSVAKEASASTGVEKYMRNRR